MNDTEFNFIPEKSMIVSGGKEETLVFWKNQLNQKDFCPRLSSEIESIIVGVDQGLVSVSLKNGTHYVLRIDNFQLEFENTHYMPISNGKNKIIILILRRCTKKL